ncbi:Indolepyruvate ferredoxin oxidoreductase, alpha and beta subunits [hydrothermal vent metagenome]|uniref:Indolepyruvate ferredoxin oxidoreductase, alpha and beta subunits n=1 Tax=hydrothermal vent metagenome TaxID=652676 RepID=A0A3B0TE47_9ZZZZ
MTLARVSLEDKYDLTKKRVFLSGTQAMVRLLLMQKARDRAAGHDTGGYVSGYRGSPLGGIDHQMGAAAKYLEPENILFRPGVNEDLAATALWGTQQINLRGDGAHDGVFGLWYGKGPGVDRTGDVFRHANFAGTAPLGGVLAFMGDDHTCESSTTAHQSEFAMMDAMMPILSPAGVQEILDYGLYGYALSRYSGCWVGIKAIKDTIEVTATVDADPHGVQIIVPDDFDMPPGGLSIRNSEHALEQEARLHDFKRFAAAHFIAANRLDRIVMAGGAKPRIGIATLGKSYLDTRQALDELGIDETRAADLGLRLYKIAAPWPLEPAGIKRFAEGLDLIIVVEEKRSLVETQIREQLYGLAGAPVIVGKRDEQDAVLLPAKAALDPNMIAVAIGERVLEFSGDERLAQKLDTLKSVLGRGSNVPVGVERIPYFCAGCPHNTSTKVPDGARAYAGIGCHYMVLWMDRATQGFTHMGGEGANWIGEAPFSSRPHVFQNLGDGTYNHSGLMAIRAAIYAGVNITYKILFNDAVAMTGGQANDGDLSVERVAREVAAFGVTRVVVVSDEPEKYGRGGGFPPHTQVRHRDNLDEIQRELQTMSGTSVIIYDQTCAAEKRRRRKRGLYPDPPKRVVINELVCEGCGDCGVQSNCVAIEPLETRFGRKRTINQSACNKDYSCLKGFCPAMVTVHGGELKKVAGAIPATKPQAADWDLPEPERPSAASPYAIVVTGVGGTGVVTLGALVGMAAHLEGKGCGVLDMAGLAQKNGAVLSHIRIADRAGDISAVRVEAGGADAIIGCDLVVTGGEKGLAVARQGRTGIVVNTAAAMTAAFTSAPDLELPVDLLQMAIKARVGEAAAHFVDAGMLAKRVVGDVMGQNLIMLGVAYQRGLLPVSAAAIEEAIALNGVAVDMNISAFRWGRRAVAEPGAAATVCGEIGAPEAAKAETLDEIIDRRAAFLAQYQNEKYAMRYRDLVGRARAAEAKCTGGGEAFTQAVARSAFKLMACKDEYEVARLLVDGSFDARLAQQFGGKYRLEYHLAPPVFARVDPATGVPRKNSYGPWMKPVFRVLAGLKGLRGTWADVFGYSDERRMERRLIADFEATVDRLIGTLEPGTHELAVRIAVLPLTIRGFGHVKLKSAEAAAQHKAELLSQLERGPASPEKAVA